MKLRLACYFPAEEPCFVPIVIDSDAYVEELSEAIYEKLRTKAHDVQLQDLRLYKADIPIEPREGRCTRALQWLHEQSLQACLDPLRKLATLFPAAPPDDTLHILVADASVVELLDTLGDPDARYRRKIRDDLDKKLGKLPSKVSPSDTVKDAHNVRAFFSEREIYRNQVPVALFSEPLATLQARLEKNDATVTSHEVSRAATYITQAIAFYDNETVRQAAIRSTIDSALGSEGQWDQKLGWAGDIKPDRCWFAGVFLSMVLELKNTPGIAGDPYDDFRGACNFPVILIGLAGSRLQISIAVCVGAIFVSDLVTIDLSRGFHGSDTTIRLARVFNALASCRRDLEDYYKGISPSPRSDSSFLYPHPISANNTPLPAIKYDKYLGLDGSPIETVPDLGARSTAVYTGTLEGGELVLIKFTYRYNDKAHILLAEAGLAPRLHFFNPIVGNLFMIVMDYIPDAKSVWHLRDKGNPLVSVIPEQVERAVSLLHNRNIVFGDLRDGNIMYIKPGDGDSTEGRVMLVDFDWAGSHDIDRYSATLNIHGGWAEGVSPYGLMRKEHDLWQMARLRELCSSNNS